jgi:hypothetical protein
MYVHAMMTVRIANLNLSVHIHRAETCIMTLYAPLETRLEILETRLQTFPPS